MARSPSPYRDIPGGWFKKNKPEPRIIRANKIKTPPKSPVSAVSVTRQPILTVLKIFLIIFTIGVIGTIGVGYIFPSDGPFGINPLSDIADTINSGPFGHITDILPYIGPLGTPQYYEKFEDNSGEKISLDGNYNCELTTTSSLGTVKTEGIFVCYQSRCSIPSERGFNGVIDSNGAFTGTNVIRLDQKGNQIDTILISGKFSSSDRFTLRGTGNGFTQIFVCEKV